MFHVHENLWRGPRPTVAALKAAGIKNIICLQSGLYELLNEDEYERFLPAEHGIKFFDLGCSDFLPPDRATVEKFLEIANIGFAFLAPTYVHCLAGKDRTGFMCAVYRMQVQGWSYKDAVAEMDRMGFHWWYWFWKFSLKRWEK